MRIASVQAFSSFEHRATISTAGDQYQDRVLASVKASGFGVDWNAILGSVENDRPPDVLEHIRRVLRQQFHTRRFVDTDHALILNGDLIAQYVQLRHEREIASRVQPLVLAPTIDFAEPPLFNPAAAAAYWQTILDLTDEEVALLLANLNSLQASSFALAGKLSAAIMNRVAELIARTIHEGLPLADFVSQAHEILPGATDAILETEYRTRLTTAYGGSRLDQIRGRSNVFPFIQFMALLDSRTTWWICRPMGIAVNGRGYIAATDDPIWLTWRPPNHYNCRSDLSPIGFLEAQRMGILARDGRTKIAIVGDNPDRPFGDPPKFASEPGTGTIRRVAPALGFGA